MICIFTKMGGKKLGWDYWKTLQKGNFNMQVEVPFTEQPIKTHKQCQNLSLFCCNLTIEVKSFYVFPTLI